MKLIDGIKLKGTPVEIPDCSRDDLPEFFKEMRYKTGAEVGFGHGEFSEKFCQVGLQMYAIDAWESYSDYQDSRGQQQLDDFFDRAKNKLSAYPNCTVIRKTSMLAVEDFKDNSLDFVYIDSNHQLRYVIDDLVEWSKKVRPGGIISGHDYIYTNPRTQAGTVHVIYAVNAFTKAYKINNWYLLGRKERNDGEIRDRFRSWMWIKP